MIDARPSYQIISGTESALHACAQRIALPATQETIGPAREGDRKRKGIVTELTGHFTASFVASAVRGPHHKDATKRQVLRVAVEGDGEAGGMGGGGVAVENRGILTVVTSST